MTSRTLDGRALNRALLARQPLLEASDRDAIEDERAALEAFDE